MGDRQCLRQLSGNQPTLTRMYFLDPLAKSYWLAKLCEANFDRLLKLIPNLPEMAGSSIAHADGKPSLHVDLLEHAPYTLTLELSHLFDIGLKSEMEPAVRVRVYLDARTAEMLSDHDRPKVHMGLNQTGNAKRVLDYKWTLNYFLSQWLDHCLAGHYCFGVSRSERTTCIEAGLN